MKTMIRMLKRPVALLLAFLLLGGAVTAFAKTDADLTANHSDSLSRLFVDRPAYCLYCGQTHTGFSGFFVRAGHDIAYFFCALFGRYPSDGRMYFTAETVDAGADEPFYFVHVSDTHLSLIDERDADDAKLMETAAIRESFCPSAVRMLDDAALKADELDTFILHTGDLIDFITQKNLDYVKQFTSQHDVFACAGNHEYSIHIWGDPEDDAQQDSVRDKLKAAFSNDIEFSTRTEHGVKFIAVDNAYYRIKPWQLARFKEEIADGMPVILCLHVPLYAQDIYEFTYDIYGDPSWLMCVPESLMTNWEEGWILHQRSDAVTDEFYDLILNSPNIKAIFAGHQHYDYVSQLTPTLKQYVTDCTQGRVVEVR